MCPAVGAGKNPAGPSGTPPPTKAQQEVQWAGDRKGVFLLKGSVSFVAKELHSSEASIYRYLGKLNSRSGK